MDKKIKGKVSLYNNTTDTTSTKYFDLDDILHVIQSSDRLKNETEQLRQLRMSDVDRYKELKRTQLPMFCSSGEFTYRNSDLGNLKNYSNILVIDFDWDIPVTNEIEEFKQRLIKYATGLHIYAVWKSPGSGVKAAMIHSNTNPIYHQELVMQVKNKLYPKTPQFDEKCKNIDRACFISYDHDLFINNNPSLSEFQFVHDPNYIPPTTTSSPQSTGRVSGKFVHTNMELFNNKMWQLKCSDKTLMNRLIRDFNRTKPNYYKDGNRHSEVLKRATIYCKDGILFENAMESLIGQFGEKSKAGLKSGDIKSMVNSCYNKARSDFGKERDKYLSQKLKKGDEPFHQ